MKDIYGFEFIDWADDETGVEVEAHSLGELHFVVRSMLEEQSTKILELYNENRKLKAELKKEKSKK